MFDFQLKRAQVALADGRLDEAFEIVKNPSLREQRSGQKLLTKLSQAFIRRGRDHIAANRLAPALADCLNAEKLAGNVSEVVELRSVICQQIETERTESRQRAEQLAQAKEQLQNGWLSTGRKMLSQTDDRQAQCLLKNADLMEAQTDSAIKRIEKALKSGQIETAAKILKNSPLHNSMDQNAVELHSQIRNQACQKLKEYLTEGQIHFASNFLNQLNGHLSKCDSLRPYRQVIDYSILAARQIENGEYEAAIVSLRKIQTILIKAKWVTELIEQAQKAAAAKVELQASPLGILETGAFSEIPDIIPSPKSPECQTSDLARGVADHHLDGISMNMCFILQIDGVGAYYVYGDNCVTIGPVSSSVRTDIELVTAPDTQPRQIERVEGDYFLGEICHSHSVKHTGKKLLQDGDCVELSKRCRFKFTTPNPASSTACLTPSSARFPRADITGVVLVAREILIGPERNCHIQTGLIPEAITLFSQDNNIRCRANQAIIVDGRPLARDNTLPANKQIEIGDVRFMLIVHES